MNKLLQFVVSLLLFFSAASFATIKSIEVITDKGKVQVPIETLRSESNDIIVIFAPYRGRKVEMKGIYLEDFIARYSSKEPVSVTLTALDDYQVSLNNWPKKHWLLVTHEDGKPLTVRQHGPVRLVESSYEETEVSNLRSFNDWIWMVTKIESN
ncbi:MAG: hypothetical protein AAGJ78_02030 [Pseudomonadota bacterium]